MKKEKKYLNFMGDTQNYKFYGPLPNPYGLRGNPDTQANSEQGGDGLNGYYRNFKGNKRSTKGNFLPAVTYGGGFYNQTGDEVTCQMCDNGYPVSTLSVNGTCPAGYTVSDGSNPCAGQTTVNLNQPQQQQSWWQRTFGSNKPDMTGWTPQQILDYNQSQALIRQQKWQNTGIAFNNAINAFSDAYAKTGGFGNQPTGNIPPPGGNVPPPGYDPYAPPQQAGMGTGQVVGIVLVAGLLIAGITYSVASAGKEG